MFELVLGSVPFAGFDYFCPVFNPQGLTGFTIFQLLQAQLLQALSLHVVSRLALIIPQSFKSTIPRAKIKLTCWIWGVCEG